MQKLVVALLLVRVLTLEAAARDTSDVAANCTLEEAVGFDRLIR
jgi:hypothetical protein